MDDAFRLSVTQQNAREVLRASAVAARACANYGPTPKALRYVLALAAKRVREAGVMTGPVDSLARGFAGEAHLRADINDFLTEDEHDGSCRHP